jgi:hypothetical protein
MVHPVIGRCSTILPGRDSVGRLERNHQRSRRSTAAPSKLEGLGHVHGRHDAGADPLRWGELPLQPGTLFLHPKANSGAGGEEKRISSSVGYAIGGLIAR